MSPLAIAIGKGVVTTVALFFVIWLLRYDAWRAGYSQGRLDERCGTDEDEHAGGIPQ